MTYAIQALQTERVRLGSIRECFRRGEWNGPTPRDLETHIDQLDHAIAILRGAEGVRKENT